MSRGSYKSVVQRKSKSFLLWKMRVYYVRAESVRLTKRAEKPLGLRCQIVSRSYFYDLFTREQR